MMVLKATVATSNLPSDDSVPTMTLMAAGASEMQPSSMMMMTTNVRTRVNAKGKHLMRSQALRESASPPRAPTDIEIVDGELATTKDVSIGSSASNKNPDDSVSYRHSCNTSPSLIACSDSSVLVTPALLDHEFPKLVQPKTTKDKSNLLVPIAAAIHKVPLLARTNSSENIQDNQKNNSSCLTGTDSNNSSDTCTAGSAALPTKKTSNVMCTGVLAKGLKPRLKSMGSSSSTRDGGLSSGFTSRDESFEQYTDSNGVDLMHFFKETLNKNTKDRNTLIRIEKELMELAMDRTRTSIKFPAMSSYNRMLIHRVAAFFGMEHNVDTTQQCVIAGITKATRVPDVRFRSLIRDDEPRKSILKRESHSFDEYRRGLLRSGQLTGEYRGGLLDRKAKSFEEREEEYECAKLRILKKREAAAAAGLTSDATTFGRSKNNHYWPSWGGSDSSAEHEQSFQQKLRTGKLSKTNRMLKVQSLSVDTKPEGRSPVTKSHSFEGYGSSHSVQKHHSTRLFGKHDSLTTSWRLSPSSSGYKTQTQSIRSDSVTPSPTGYESAGDRTPEPMQSLCGDHPTAGACGVVWAVTDMAAVPPGSVLIDPQTLQPIVNNDGSLYHFDPENPPIPANHRRQPKPTILAENDEKTVSTNAEREEGADTDVIGDQLEDHCENEPPQQESYAADIDLACEISNIESKTSEMVITNNSDIHMNNNMIIRANEASEADPAVDYDDITTGLSVHHTSYTDGTAHSIPSTGLQYITYPAPDVTTPSGTLFVPVYSQRADNTTNNDTQPQIPHQNSPAYQEVQQSYPNAVASNVATAAYAPAAQHTNLVHTLHPLVYQPAQFHGADTAHLPTQMASLAPAHHQLVYAPTTTLDRSSISAGQTSAPQYFTIPMGYHPCAYNDPIYTNYWPNAMTTYYIPQAISSNSTSYPIHPQATPTTVYPVTNKRRSSLTIQQQHQQQMASMHHAQNLHYHHHAPYAMATTNFNACESSPGGYNASPPPSGAILIPYPSTAADDSPTNPSIFTGGESLSGPVVEGLYPIQQPMYATNFVQQTYLHQYQQKQQQVTHHQLYQQPQQQLIQQALTTTTTTTTAPAPIAEPPVQQQLPPQPATITGSKFNMSNSSSSGHQPPSQPNCSDSNDTSPSSPTSITAVSALTPISIAPNLARAYQPYDSETNYDIYPRPIRYHQQHSNQMVEQTFGCEIRSPYTSADMTAVHRKSTASFHNGYAHQSGSHNNSNLIHSARVRLHTDPNAGQHYQQPHQNVQTSHQLSLAAAGYSGNIASTGYPKNPYKFHMQKRSAVLPSSDAQAMSAISEPNGCSFNQQYHPRSSAPSTANHISKSTFRSSLGQSHQAHHSVTPPPLIAFHHESKYRLSSGLRHSIPNKSTYHGAKLASANSNIDVTTTTTTTPTAKHHSTAATNRSSPPSAMMPSTDSTNDNSCSTGGVNGGGGGAAYSMPTRMDAGRSTSPGNRPTPTASAVHHHHHSQHNQTQNQLRFGAPASTSSSAAVAAAAAMATSYPGNASASGMFVKLGQAYFPHRPSMSFASMHQRTKMYAAKDDRPSQISHPPHHHLTDMIPSMNMMLNNPRILNPRSSNHNMIARNPRPK